MNIKITDTPALTAALTAVQGDDQKAGMVGVADISGVARRVDDLLRGVSPGARRGTRATYCPSEYGLSMPASTRVCTIVTLTHNGRLWEVTQVERRAVPVLPGAPGSLDLTVEAGDQAIRTAMRRVQAELRLFPAGRPGVVR
jgi:hypothetical protein